MREMMEDCMNEIQTNGVKLRADNEAIDNLIKAFDLEEAPF